MAFAPDGSEKINTGLNGIDGGAEAIGAGNLISDKHETFRAKAWAWLNEAADAYEAEQTTQIGTAVAV